MKHPKMPTQLYDLLDDQFTEVSADTDSPEWILANLKKWSVQNENKSWKYFARRRSYANN